MSADNQSHHAGSSAVAPLLTSSDATDPADSTVDATRIFNWGTAFPSAIEQMYSNDHPRNADLIEVFAAAGPALPRLLAEDELKRKWGGVVVLSDADSGEVVGTRTYVDSTWLIEETRRRRQRQRMLRAGIIAINVVLVAVTMVRGQRFPAVDPVLLAMGTVILAMPAGNSKRRKARGTAATRAT